ncbi:unnamed protein product [Spirodela intermedia]|uniref:Uncharacterized protein n=1 Tax=Spirodela intermedia TaxID=51605 RepID=A0A7I8IJZ6_SPIIN|nr:unnamed protein product [Spirodela intermedia]CAA6658070.1 unnamed protein product [Spirodela intermedia]
MKRIHMNNKKFEILLEQNIHKWNPKMTSDILRSFHYTNKNT